MSCLFLSLLNERSEENLENHKYGLVAKSFP